MDIVIVGWRAWEKVVRRYHSGWQGRISRFEFVDADVTLAGSSIGGLPVIGPANVLPKLRQQKVRGAIIAIGDCLARMQYAELLREQGGLKLDQCDSSDGQHLMLAAKAGG